MRFQRLIPRAFFDSARLRCQALALLLSVSACRDPEVPGGKITIRNDILDKEFNSFVIDEVTVGGARAGFRKELKPGEQVSLPFRQVSSLRVTRRYSNHSNIYLVDCPTDFNTHVKMNLIDIHSNRMAGGCVLTKRGEFKAGRTDWEE